MSTEKFSFNYNNIYIINQISVFKIYSIYSAVLLPFLYISNKAGSSYYSMIPGLLIFYNFKIIVF